MTALRAAIAVHVVAGLGLGSPARAESRVITAPTAELVPPGALAASAGIDHRGAASGAVGLGVGGLAELELAIDRDVACCALPRAGFRLGVPADTWFRGMPAVALGVRNTFARRPRVTELTAVASRRFGPLDAHAGAAVIAAGDPADDDAPPRHALRPLAGLVYHPPQFPRTSLLADLAWTARGPGSAWIAGLGVRYQAFSWSAIELAVRTREDDGLGGSSVVMRFHALLTR